MLTSQRRRDVGLSYLDREQNDFLLDARLQQEDGTPLLNEEQKAAIFESLGGHLRPLCNHLIPDLQTPGADLNSESCLYFLFLQVLFRILVLICSFRFSQSCWCRWRWAARLRLKLC